MIWDDRLEENLRKHDDYNNGKYEGIDIGIEQKQTEMIINMYNKKFDINTIAEISNLSIEEVNNIIENNKGTN